MYRQICLLLLFLIACTPIQQPEAEIVPTETPSAVEEVVVSDSTPETTSKVYTEVPPIEMVENECSEIGCPIGTMFIGDAKTDLYYECRCTFVKWIKPSDLLCFDSEEEAKERGYKKAQSC